MRTKNISMNQANQELLKEIDLLCSLNKKNIITDINKYEKWHKEKVLTTYGRYSDQFKLFYELLNDIINEVNFINKSDWSNRTGAQLLLITHNLKSIYSSFTKSLDGFYEDSLILLRPAYEAFIKLVYISCHLDEDAYTIIAGKKDSQKVKFNLTHFIKNDLNLGWTEYMLTSAMTHGNLYSVLNEAIEIQKNGQTEPISLKFEYNKTMLEVCINYIRYVLYVYLKTSSLLFITKDTNDTLNKHGELAQKLTEFIEKDFLSHKKDYFPTVIKDTKDIFTLLENMKKSSNWRKEWEDIRK